MAQTSGSVVSRGVKGRRGGRTSAGQVSGKFLSFLFFQTIPGSWAEDPGFETVCGGSCSREACRPGPNVRIRPEPVLYELTGCQPEWTLG